MKKHKQITGITKYTTHYIHEKLCNRWLSEGYNMIKMFIETQALYCPYYVPLSGPLGLDWGIIVNPLSSRFGMVTFEHDYCGCPDHWKKVGHQDGRDWIKNWSDHQNDDFWIED
jgi:hypothetical protein